MADNTVLNPGSGGDEIINEEITTGVKMPVSKIHVGADGDDDGPVTTANPFPTLPQTGLVPFAVDEMEVTSIDGDGNPLIIVYKASTVTVATVSCTYTSGTLSCAKRV